MSNSLMKRIFDALFFAVWTFIVYIVIFKLFLHREDWLSSSMVLSISVAIGYFVAQNIATLEKGIRFNIMIDVVIIVTVFILGAFVMSVLLDIAEWNAILANALVPFGVSLIATNTFKKCNKD